MKNLMWIIVVAPIAFASTAAHAQQWHFDRLSGDLLDVVPPSEWVQGLPGEMTVRPLECRSLPPEGLRGRIIDIAVQEWAFFGFPVLDRTNGARLLPPGASSSNSSSSAGPAFETSRRRAPLLSREEAARVAASIAGYWAVTPEGAGIVADQNRAWNGPQGVAVRWRSPWSAAFISWVMCEAGLGTNDRFRRAIAHRSYIDQAIRARDGQAPGAAYVAYDIGERVAEPGDLLCSARRPAYRNLAERRRHMGEGARTHCDVVVQVHEETERILAIGGNVLRSVSLKVLAGERDPEGGLRPRSAPGAPLFAHLRLRADPVERNALMRSATIAAFACLDAGELPDRAAFVVSELAVPFEPGWNC